MEIRLVMTILLFVLAITEETVPAKETIPESTVTQSSNKTKSILKNDTKEQPIPLTNDTIKKEKAGNTEGGNVKDQPVVIVKTQQEDKGNVTSQSQAKVSNEDKKTASPQPGPVNLPQTVVNFSEKQNGIEKHKTNVAQAERQKIKTNDLKKQVQDHSPRANEIKQQLQSVLSNKERKQILQEAKQKQKQKQQFNSSNTDVEKQNQKNSSKEDIVLQKQVAKDVIQVRQSDKMGQLQKQLRPNTSSTSVSISKTEAKVTEIKQNNPTPVSVLNTEVKVKQTNQNKNLTEVSNNESSAQETKENKVSVSVLNSQITQQKSISVQDSNIEVNIKKTIPEPKLNNLIVPASNTESKVEEPKQKKSSITTQIYQKTIEDQKQNQNISNQTKNFEIKADKSNQTKSQIPIVQAPKDSGLPIKQQVPLNNKLDEKDKQTDNQSTKDLNSNSKTKRSSTLIKNSDKSTTSINTNEKNDKQQAKVTQKPQSETKSIKPDEQKRETMQVLSTENKPQQQPKQQPKQSQTVIQSSAKQSTSSINLRTKPGKTQTLTSSQNKQNLSNNKLRSGGGAEDITAPKTIPEQPKPAVNKDKVQHQTTVVIKNRGQRQTPKKQLTQNKKDDSQKPINTKQRAKPETPHENPKDSKTAVSSTTKQLEHHSQPTKGQQNPQQQLSITKEVTSVSTHNSPHNNDHSPQSNSITIPSSLHNINHSIEQPHHQTSSQQQTSQTLTTRQSPHKLRSQSIIQQTKTTIPTQNKQIIEKQIQDTTTTTDQVIKISNKHQSNSYLYAIIVIIFVVLYSLWRCFTREDRFESVSQPYDTEDNLTSAVPNWLQQSSQND